MTGDGLARRYLPGGLVLHALYRATASTSVCGVGPQWWTGAGWQTDDGTVALRKCRRCAVILRAEDRL